MNGSDELLTTKQRMQYILESRNVSVYDLCSGGADRGKVGNQIYKETALTEQTIQLFLSRFEDVSADWLLRGHGPTYWLLAIRCLFLPTTRRTCQRRQSSAWQLRI